MYLFGAGGHAKVIIEILEACGEKIEGVFDDKPGQAELLGYAVSKAPDHLKGNTVIISVGDNHIRKALADRLQADYSTAIHPNATIAARAVIGPGSVVMGNTIINADTKIGKHVIVNTSASIDHDCILEDFVHVSPNATLSGNVSVGEGAHIGSGATIIPNVRIGKWTVIGAGAVIIRNVPDFAVVVGNPGRVIRIGHQA